MPKKKDQNADEQKIYRIVPQPSKRKREARRGIRLDSIVNVARKRNTEGIRRKRKKNTKNEKKEKIK